MSWGKRKLEKGLNKNVMPDLIRHPVVFVSKINLDSPHKTAGFPSGFRRNDVSITLLTQPM
jgi:hypothetical protein